MDITLGLILIIVGIILLGAEAIDPGFFIAIPGGVLLALGIMTVVAPGLLISIWSPIIVAAIIIPLTVISMKFYQRISPPSKPTTTMTSSLVGEPGKVMKEVKPDELSGKVKVENQIWSATTEDAPIEKGTKVVIMKAKGVHLVVKEKESK